MLPRTRRLTVVAQDPSVKERGRILTAEVEVPAEDLEPGPQGHRVHVVDYDASEGRLYAPFVLPPPAADGSGDPYAQVDGTTIRDDPGFHAQNVYALVVRTLARFEFALGRRVGWGFRSHLLKVAPHAFVDANAFYSEADEGLMFGYFPGRHGTVQTCLAHDVVVHETTHALLDGVRDRLTEPSSAEQAAFHEGFSDVVALLSVFSLPEVVGHLLGKAGSENGARNRLHQDLVKPEHLMDTSLFGLAEEMGEYAGATRGNPLRRSVLLDPADIAKSRPEEPHELGEVLVAAVLQAFVQCWTARLASIGPVSGEYLDRERVAEEGSVVADLMLTMAIRALDYCPPVHLCFGDLLSAMLTADREVRPDDRRFRLREHMRESFAKFGIRPSAYPKDKEGYWVPAPEGLNLGRVRFDALTRSPEEVFRFLWENRRFKSGTKGGLDFFPSAHLRVESVRPCVRVAPEDGAVVRETVAECVQHLRLRASELAGLGIRKPDAMPDSFELMLVGGLTLIFDDFGRLKYAVTNGVRSERQSERLQSLWDFGYFQSTRRWSDFARRHRLKALGGSSLERERW